MGQEVSAAGGSFDVVVIGSGFGGAAVACRMAQAGKSVAILERGRRFPLGAGDFQRTGHGARTLRYGHFQIDQGTGMNVIRGIGVGGGSLHYFGVKLKPWPEIFDGPRWPAGITRKVLDPYYELAGDMIPAGPVQANPVTGTPVRGEAFLKAAQACRRCHEAEWTPLAVHTGEAPAQTPAGVPMTRCVFCGDCLVGCPASETFDGNVNARALLTLNYLAVAEDHKAQIFPEHFVETIAQGKEGFEVRFRLGDPEECDDPRFCMGPPEVVRARQVVLGAGTLGSTEILLKSRRTLPQLSPHLGRYFSGNGDFILAKTKGTGTDLQPKTGPLILAGGDFSTAKNKIYIEDLGAIPLLGSLVGLEKGRVTPRGRYQMRYLGMGTDAGNGVLRLKCGQIHLDWDPTDSLPMYNEMIAALQELSQQLNGVYANPRKYNPKTGTGLITAHPLGGCPMGDSVATGVVDAQGQIYGVPGLFVADGAIIPSAVAVNPSFTISALAERVAFHMLHGRDLRDGDPDTPTNRRS